MQVNMLYLGTQVLILLDLSYVSRFWTQFEAWLSMQFATPKGLRSAVGNTRNERHHIVPIQAAAQSGTFTNVLIDQWATKTPQQAFEFLSKPDVTVTNQSDKDGQLPKIASLGETVQSAFKAVDTQLQQQVAAAEGQALRAQVALEAWEAENYAQAVAQHPAKVALADAERELVAAREAKQRHEVAIKQGVMPMVMEREEVQEAAEEAARKEAEEAEEARKVAAAQKEARERWSSHFRGPCKGFCKQCCACCVSADGRTLYGCVPIAAGEYPFYYLLPLCLHMCLCPQQGGDPCPVDLSDTDSCGGRLCSGIDQLVLVNPFLFCCQSKYYTLVLCSVGDRR